MPAESTQCCRLTGPGRSAVAVIGVHGQRAVDVVVACFAINGPRALQPLQVRYGNWHGGHQQEKLHPNQESEHESIVICQIDEDTVEVHCHGGKAAIDRIIADLAAHQVTEMTADQWQSQRSLLAISEARAVLSQCLSERTAAVAMQQTRGALTQWAETARARIDESDANLADIRRSARVVADDSKFGIRLAEPFRVILAGQPNVGKSSLVNAIVATNGASHSTKPARRVTFCTAKRSSTDCPFGSAIPPVFARPINESKKTESREPKLPSGTLTCWSGSRHPSPTRHGQPNTRT